MSGHTIRPHSAAGYKGSLSLNQEHRHRDHSQDYQGNGTLALTDRPNALDSSAQAHRALAFVAHGLTRGSAAPRMLRSVRPRCATWLSVGLNRHPPHVALRDGL